MYSRSQANKNMRPKRITENKLVTNSNIIKQANKVGY